MKGKRKKPIGYMWKRPQSLRVLALGKVSCATLRDRQKAMENSFDGLMMTDGSLLHSF